MRIVVGLLVALLSFAPACGGDSSGNDVADADDGIADDSARPDDVSGSDGEAEADAEADAGAGKRVFGVTVTDPWVADSPTSTLTDRLDGLVGAGGRKPAARVVFDEGIDRVFHAGGLDATAYVELSGNIAPHATVMGELLDSLYVGDYDVGQYRARACEYRATLGHLVDIWEIGNEVNGEWLGEGVVDKLAAAAAVFGADGAGFAAACPGFALRADEKPFEIALTLYYNGPYDGGVPTENNCWSEADHALDFWVDRDFGTPGATGTESVAPVLDYVLVSYYEDDCDGIQPEWQPVFEHLAAVFPDAWLGFGECGTEDAAGKAGTVRRYYHGMDLPDAQLANMHVVHPRYVGGFFWWYFSDDMGDADVYGALADALDNPFWAAGS